MKFSLRTFGHHLLAAVATATTQAWVMVLCVAAVLSVLRMIQISWHWPAGFDAPLSDLWVVLVQGLRFDLKVCAAAALLIWPLLTVLPVRLHGWLTGIVTVLFVTASLINLHYFGFYKTPIDPVVFGFFEDDTRAILRTIWSDFPVFLTLAVLVGASGLAMRARRITYGRLSLHLNRGLSERRVPVWLTLLAVLVALLMLVLTTKGTLRAMALGRQNVSVTTSQFLNDMVPNGVIALKFAWDARRDSQNLSDPLLGLKRLGYGSPLEAARVLGLDAPDEQALRAALFARGGATPVPSAQARKNLLFFLMESWSAEPFLYQDAKNFDVLGRLAPTLKQACHFSNFDSAQPGTHPALEALLFSSPITPLTLGVHGQRPIPWAVPLLMRQAGYRTVFLTSTRSGWRNLDRVLKVQGFDEVVDANTLKARYPEAELGIWGVWDHYLFRYLSERLKQPQPQPLFVFVLTATNHPPYDMPADYPRPALSHAKWGGDNSSNELWPNLDTYRYATDLLGGLVQEVNASPLRDKTIIAATGDHNGRSFGLYADPRRHDLLNQVPFVIWDQGLDCGPQRRQPASHRDMFPTLFPLLGIQSGYVKTGRDLLAPIQATAGARATPHMAVNYFGFARNVQGSWKLGDPASFICTPPRQQDAGKSCAFDPAADAMARAQVGLLDWNVRVALRR